MYRWDFVCAGCDIFVVDGECDFDSVSTDNDIISATQRDRDINRDVDRVAIRGNSDQSNQNSETDADTDADADADAETTTHDIAATDFESADAAEEASMMTNSETNEMFDDPDANTHHVVSNNVDDKAEARWRKELAETNKLTPAIVDSIITHHGDRGTRAIEAVSEKRVKRYRDFTVVVGHHDEYIVEAGGCTCKDSLYNLDPTDPTQCCWHVLATAVAERIGAIDYHDMWYSDVHDFLS